MAPRQPNILMVLMDDMGWNALSCYGNTIVPTPNLDRLAREGVRFTQAYVTPQCTPTRASILTGQYTARNRMWHVIPWYGMPWARVREEPFVENLPRGHFTLAKGLRDAGYRTACIGKWHLTANEDGHYTNLRNNAAPHYGFDYAAAEPARPGEQNTGDKMVDRLTGEAIAFMEQNRSRPFFCYLAHHTIHGKVVAPEVLTAKWRARGAPETGLNHASYLAALEHMDQSIGRLLASVDRLGLREQTAVFFLTDNGGVDRVYNPQPLPGDPPRLQVREREFASAPLRGMKGTAYEGGIRVPLIVRWPGVAQAGTVCDTPVHAVDLMPTCFAAAGAGAPSGYVTDGVSLAPLLRGGRIRERALYWYMPFYDLRWGATPSAVIRQGEWKLIESFGDWVDIEKHEYHEGARLELYRVDAHGGETQNQAAAQANRVQAMRQDLHAWIRSCGAAIPKENPRHDRARAFEETKDRTLAGPA
jgi:uncharacterized sulfatase